MSQLEMPRNLFPVKEEYPPNAINLPVFLINGKYFNEISSAQQTGFWRGTLWLDIPLWRNPCLRLNISPLCQHAIISIIQVPTVPYFTSMFSCQGVNIGMLRYKFRLRLLPLHS